MNEMNDEIESVAPEKKIIKDFFLGRTNYYNMVITLVVFIFFSARVKVNGTHTEMTKQSSVSVKYKNCMTDFKDTRHRRRRERKELVVCVLCVSFYSLSSSISYPSNNALNKNCKQQNCIIHKMFLINSGRT